MNFLNRNTYDKSKGGFGVHEFIDPFNETFHKTNYRFFRRFILNPLGVPLINKIISDIEKEKNNNLKESRLRMLEYMLYKRWNIISDYAFGDKPQDVISFVLMPDIFNLNDLKSIINHIQPTDIKRTSHISDNFIYLLNNYPILSISIIVNKNLRLYSEEMDYFLHKLGNYIKMVNYWMKKEPANEPRYRKQIQSLCKLKMIISKGTGLKYIRQIEIVSTLLSYIMIEVTKLIPNIESIKWFSDRDIILDYKKKELGFSIARDFVQTIYHILCEKWSYGKADIIFAEPERKGAMWYDELIRLPDYISGTLADYNKEKGTSSHKKFCPILKKVFTNNCRHLFFELNINMKDNVSIECVRWFFSLKPL